MNNYEILDTYNFSPHSNPKKLIFMLHGYGDNAENFLQICKFFHIQDWKTNYFAFNAPLSIPNYPNGRQWFDLYPNGIYINDAGEKEISIIRSEIEISLKKIQKSIEAIINNYNLKYSDCFIMGFSQGGMMTFELGNFIQKSFAGIAIISGKIISTKEKYSSSLIKTPIFISHGENDEVLVIENYYRAIKFLEQSPYIFENHLIKDDNHNISSKTINLFQKFIKKYL